MKPVLARLVQRKERLSCGSYVLSKRAHTHPPKKLTASSAVNQKRWLHFFPVLKSDFTNMAIWYASLGLIDSIYRAIFVFET